METNEYYFYLGKILRTRRKAEGLTLETLSRQIRKSGSTISKYESGTVSIPVDVLVDICEVLHIDVSVLLHHVDYRCYQEMSLKQDWIYWYDGIARKLCLGVLEYTRENEPAAFFGMYATRITHTTVIQFTVGAYPPATIVLTVSCEILPSPTMS